jgi:hypothetical protein
MKYNKWGRVQKFLAWHTKARAKRKMLRIYSAIYGEVNISVSGSYMLQYAGGTRASTCFIVTWESWSDQKLLNPTYINILHKNCNVVHFFHTSVKVSCRIFTVCWTLYTLFLLQLKPAIMSSSPSKFIYFLTVPSYTDRNVLGGSLFPSSFPSPSALNPSDVADNNTHS